MRALGLEELDVEYNAFQAEPLDRFIRILLPNVGSLQVFVAGADQQRVQFVRMAEHFGRNQVRGQFAGEKRVQQIVLDFVVRRNGEVK